MTASRPTPNRRTPRMRETRRKPARAKRSGITASALQKLKNRALQIAANAIVYSVLDFSAMCPSGTMPGLYHSLRWPIVDGRPHITCECEARVDCWHMPALRLRLTQDGWLSADGVFQDKRLAAGGRA